MIDGETRIRLAWAIAKMLDDAVVSGPEGNMILAMALGIFVEGQDGSHRDMLPLAEATLKTAQVTFDALRAGRKRKPANA